MTVGQILDVKGRALFSISPDRTVFDALTLLAEKNVGAVVVLDGHHLVGIFSERDYARKVALKGKSSRDLSVREVMTEAVISVRPEQTIEECMQLMTGKRIRHLPVVENNAVTGVISIGDVVNAIIEEQKSRIDDLEGYITGRR